MRTGEVAEQSGVNIETLRYYERGGLLQAPGRGASGYRVYESETVRTVRFINKAQQLGFSLAEIEVLLDLAGGGPKNCDAARAPARTVANAGLRAAPKPQAGGSIDTGVS